MSGLSPASVRAGDIVGIRCPDGATAYDSSGPWLGGAASCLGPDSLLLVICVISHPPVGRPWPWEEALVVFGDCGVGWVELSELRAL